MEKIVIAGALRECVHVAGVSNFLRLAEMAGWRTVFLGPATPLETFIATAQQEQASTRPGKARMRSSPGTTISAPTGRRHHRSIA